MQLPAKHQSQTCQDQTLRSQMTNLEESICNSKRSFQTSTCQNRSQTGGDNNKSHWTENRTQNRETNLFRTSSKSNHFKWATGHLTKHVKESPGTKLNQRIGWTHAKQQSWHGGLLSQGRKLNTKLTTRSTRSLHHQSMPTWQRKNPPHQARSHSHWLHVRTHAKACFKAIPSWIDKRLHLQLTWQQSLEQAKPFQLTKIFPSSKACLSCHHKDSDTDQTAAMLLRKQNTKTSKWWFKPSVKQTKNCFILHQVLEDKTHPCCPQEHQSQVQTPMVESLCVLQQNN